MWSDVLLPQADSSISLLHDTERPDVAYTDVGGLDVQKQEIREAVELPLTHFDLYKQIGIDPPRYDVGRGRGYGATGVEEWVAGSG